MSACVVWRILDIRIHVHPMASRKIINIMDVMYQRPFCSYNDKQVLLVLINSYGPNVNIKLQFHIQSMSCYIEPIIHNLNLDNSVITRMHKLSLLVNTVVLETIKTFLI